MVNDTPLRLASIDIGSNAVRLFVGQKSRDGRIRVLADQRAGVRLGADAFSSGFIRPETQSELVYALKHFKDVCEFYKVEHVRAVGTSALRDAKNSARVVLELKKSTGLDIKLINGQLEAALLHKAVSHVVDLSQKTALLLDMGGGSLEVVLSRRAKLITKTSLLLGTVRLLARVPQPKRPEDFARLARTSLYKLRGELLAPSQDPPDLLVGTGGNLRALAKLCFRLGLSRTRGRFQPEHLELLAERLFSMSLTQRIKRFGLRLDRADVILPAAAITLELMRIFEVEEILAPNVGLKNGLFWDAIDRSRLKHVPRRHLTRQSLARRKKNGLPVD